jgi:hypothetical protein
VRNHGNGGTRYKSSQTLIDLHIMGYIYIIYLLYYLFIYICICIQSGAPQLQIGLQTNVSVDILSMHPNQATYKQISRHRRRTSLYMNVYT